MARVKLKTILGTIVLGLLTFFLIKSELRVRSGTMALQKYSEQCEQLALQIGDLSNSLAVAMHSKEQSEEQLRELLKLRSEVAILRQRDIVSENLAPPEAITNRNAFVVEPESIPRDSWTFLGYETPQTAFQSLLWAMKTGNVNAYFDSLVPAMQQAMRARFRDKTESEISATLQEGIKGLEAIRLDRIKNSSDAEATFVLNSQETDNGNVKTRDEATLTFKNIGGQWKSLDGL